VLTKVSAYSFLDSAQALDVSEQGIYNDFIHIKEIEGLGPVEAAISTTPYGSVDGEAYSGSHVASRNIVITLGLNSDWDTWPIEKLRRLLYRYFMPKQKVRLVFESDDALPDMYIEGYTETVEPALFAKDPEIQVSIICPDPYFYGLTPITATGETPEDEFVTVNYEGSIDTGFLLTINHEATPTPNNLYTHVGDEDNGVFGVSIGVSSTVYFYMNSILGQKFARTVDTSSGVITNRIAQVHPGSVWPTLKPGLNDIYVYSDMGEQTWSVQYVPKFGGL